MTQANNAQYFTDNRDGNTQSNAICRHLKALRAADESPSELCIATGYFNAAGWLKVAKEAEQVGKVRLLLGAEPTPNSEMKPRQPGDLREPARTKKQVQDKFGQQVQGLKTERDQSFDFAPDQLGKLESLVEFFSSGRVEVRRYPARFFHAKAWVLRGENRSVIAGSSNLTAAGMSRNLELNLGHYSDPVLEEVEKWYDEVWEEAELFDLAELYKDLFQEFSPWLIYLRVLWELYGGELEEEEEETGHLTLTTFQKHGVWRARRILEDLGGVVIADGVGLGKTFVAGGLMESYRDRRQRILLIRPAALTGTWKKFLSDYYLGDVESISYEKLAGDEQLGGDKLHLKRPINEYQLIVIDEAHNYRNPDARTRAGALRQLLRGPRRDLVLLTATPVNNSLYDLYHLLSYFLKLDSRLIKKDIPSIKGIFDEANKVEPGDLNPDLLFPLVDATTVKRTRQFIKKHYLKDRIPGPGGELVPITFPKPVTHTVHYDFDAVLPGFFERFAEALMPDNGEPSLTMARYQVSRYLLVKDDEMIDETPVVGLLRSGLLKRFESSVHAFANTCRKMAKQHQSSLDAMDSGYIIRKDFFKEYGVSQDLDEDEFQELLVESENTDPIDLYDHKRLREDIDNDLQLLTEFAEEAEIVKPEDDPKLVVLIEELAAVAKKAETDSSTDADERDKRKVLIFSYYKDTAIWIIDWLKKQVNQDKRLECYRGRLAATCGDRGDANVLNSDQAAWGFAPVTSAPEAYTGGDLFDVLVSTDVLAEGVNLQQCCNIINYDLPWNPMRLIQRHGRIDRLLSNHKRVYLRTYFPDKSLDGLLKLEERVRRKLAMAAASVGISDAPIQDGAKREQSFTENRDEIEQIEREETNIFEKGGTDSAAQTGEEYRQELRKVLETGKMKDEITELPWKIGSGMIKGQKTGYFFCAKIGGQTFLRFVPADATKEQDIIQGMGTCLRLIECSESTQRVLSKSFSEGVYDAWALARKNIWNHWDFFTDSKNLQPSVRKLNHEVDEFLQNNPPEKMEQEKLDEISDILLSPWPRREENKLRLVWKEEYINNKDKAAALIESVIETGIEPFEQPDRYPKIENDEVKLICWLGVQGEG
jgi:hypothetical protein